MSAHRKIQATKNYRLFSRSRENRPLDIHRHRKLELSMKTYGFLPCFPIVCNRDKNGNLIVKDGQHRLAIAESLGISVYWVEESVDFDVAVINCTAKTWVLRDYAQKFASNGKKDYQDGLDFADEHHLPVGTAFCLLAGTTGFSTCHLHTMPDLSNPQSKPPMPANKLPNVITHTSSPAAGSVRSRRRRLRLSLTPADKLLANRGQHLFVSAAASVPSGNRPWIEPHQFVPPRSDH